jgi:hypothetical protein
MPEVVKLRVAVVNGHLRAFGRNGNSPWSKLPSSPSPDARAALQIGANQVWWPTPILALLHELSDEAVIHATHDQNGNTARETVVFGLRRRITTLSNDEQLREQAIASRNDESSASIAIVRAGVAIHTLVFEIAGLSVGTPIRQTIEFHLTSLDGSLKVSPPH